MKRQEVKDMVIYLLKGKYVDDDEVIDSYTDSLWNPIQQLQEQLQLGVNAYRDMLERRIEGCDNLGGMEREKAAYQDCLREVRKLKTN